MPQPVLEAMQNHLQLEAEIGGYEAAAARKEELDAFYQQLAAFLHTQPHQIAYAHQATQAFNTALSSIPFRDGDVILTTYDDYVSNQIAFMQLKTRFGVAIQHAANLPGGGVDLEDFERKLRQYAPKLVAVTHIPTNSGLIQPVETIGQLCAPLDCWYLVDACQSAGQVAY
jgi:selenocysteine lyase/cysteine desulfurase